ncbi:MAG: N-acetyltransferase family protein [Pseudomonadota bacterium]|jgi:phosphinothricin acetyltransferase
MVAIRSAREADVPAILAIYNDAILHTTAVYDYAPHTLEMRLEWFRAKQQDGFPVLVAEEAGEVVGFGALGPFRAWAAYKYTVENSIYVAPGRRGQGIGKRLLPPLIEAARALDMHAIVAGIDAANEVSLRLHRAFGFEQVAHFRQVGYKFGRWLDLVFMQRLLDTPAQPRED